MFVPSRPNRQERILGFGSWGCGKSRFWLRTFEDMLAAGADFKIFCADSDDAIDVMLDSYPRVAERIDLVPVWDWDELKQTTDRFRREAGQGDWIVVDFVDLSWDWAQAHYTSQIFRKGFDEFFMEYRRRIEEMKLKVDSANPLDGWKDWSVINKLYHSWAQPFFHRTKAHIYCTAKVEAVDNRTDDMETKVLFGAHGVKPKGQKHLVHNFHTALWFRSPKTGVYQVTSIKDRERTLLTGEDLRHPLLQYFVKIGGWRKAQ